MTAKTPTDYPVGATINFIVGPTKVRVDNAIVIDHVGQFMVTKDENGKIRKVRPGSVV